MPSKPDKFRAFAERRTAKGVPTVTVLGKSVPVAMVREMDALLTRAFGPPGYKPSIDVLKEEGKL